MKLNQQLSLVFIFLIFGCNHTSNAPKLCSLSHMDTATVAGQLQYDVSATGSATVTSITYVGNTGSITVTNPVLPFEVNLQILAGATISIAVEGLTPTGNITGGYTFLANTGGIPMVVKATCN